MLSNKIPAGGADECSALDTLMTRTGFPVTFAVFKRIGSKPIVNA